jgi:N-acyl-D-amino-acid deacylase
MTKFVEEHEVPGAALAVVRHGKLAYARGFGLADKEKKLPVKPDALFRIASISKPFTAVAVLQLAERKKLGLDDPVLKHMKLDPPEGAKLDPRWKDITVRHCLQHTGGWDRAMSGDPIGIPAVIAKALKIEFPVSPEAVVRYTMLRRLDFDPGERYAYSNVGYLVLGRIIEAVSGRKYEEYVRAEVLAPIGVTRMRLGRALPENRPADEVAYHDRQNRTSACVYPPRVGERVPIADGAMNVEGFEAHGGWVASAVDLVRFARAFDEPARCKLLSADSIKTMWARPAGAAGFDAGDKPKPAYYGCGWFVRADGPPGRANTFHGGLLSPGTSTLLVRRWDGLSWAVLFNTHAGKDGKTLSGLIDPLVHQAADAVTKWPEADLFEKR